MHPFFLTLLVLTALAEERALSSPQRKGTCPDGHFSHGLGRLDHALLVSNRLSRWNRNRNARA